MYGFPPSPEGLRWLQALDAIALSAAAGLSPRGFSWQRSGDVTTAVEVHYAVGDVREHSHSLLTAFPVVAEEEGLTDAAAESILNAFAGQRLADYHGALDLGGDPEEQRGAIWEITERCATAERAAFSVVINGTAVRGRIIRVDGAELGVATCSGKVLCWDGRAVVEHGVHLLPWDEHTEHVG